MSTLNGFFIVFIIGLNLAALMPKFTDVGAEWDGRGRRLDTLVFVVAVVLEESEKVKKTLVSFVSLLLSLP